MLNVLINTSKREVIIDEKSYILMRRTLRILACMNNDNPTSGDKLKELVRCPSTKTIDVHIYYLRKILGKNAILNKKGIGFKLNNIQITLN